MTILKLKKSLEAGVYNAKIDRIEEMNTKYGDAFKIIYATEDGQEASELVNMSYTKKSKLGERAWGILKDIPMNLDITQFIGAKVVIELEDRPGSDFCKVVSVKRQAGSQPTAPPQPSHDYNNMQIEESPF